MPTIVKFKEIWRQLIGMTVNKILMQDSSVPRVWIISDFGNSQAFGFSKN